MFFNSKRYILEPRKKTSLQSRRYILIINIHNRGINTTQFYMSSIDNPWYPILKFLNFPVA